MLRFYTIFFMFFFLLWSATPASAGEEAISARTAFTLLPESIFENTIEGLTPTEKQILLTQGASEFWEIEGETPDVLVVTSIPLHDSAVATRIFRNTSKPSVLVAVGTLGAPICALELWKIDALGRTVPIDTPSEPDVQEFFTQDNPMPPDVQGSVMLCLGLDGLKAQPMFWTKTGMAHVPVYKDIVFLWNGAAFEKTVVQRTP